MYTYLKKLYGMYAYLKKVDHMYTYLKKLYDMYAYLQTVAEHIIVYQVTDGINTVSIDLH